MIHLLLTLLILKHHCNCNIYALSRIYTCTTYICCCVFLCGKTYQPGTIPVDLDIRCDFFKFIISSIIMHLYKKFSYLYNIYIYIMIFNHQYIFTYHIILYRYMFVSYHILVISYIYNI